MKKSLIAFAVLSAFASAASAQSSVVLYGIIDTSTSIMSNQTAAGGKKLSMENSNLTPSRWGIKGSEELSDGMKANFNLESSLNVDTGMTGAAGSSLFDRTATIGLSGAFGSFNAGRQTSLAYDTIIQVDPTGFAHLGSNPNVQLGAMGNAMYNTHGSSNGATAAARQNNSIKYTFPSVLGGVSFAAMYGFGEKAGDTIASSYAGASASYSENGMTAVFSYGQMRDAANNSTLRSYTGGVKLAAGTDWTVKVSYSENEVNVSTRTISVFGVGADYALSPTTTLTGAYYANRRSGDMQGKADQFVGIAKYAFSKRTSVYASVSYAKADTVQAKDTDMGLFIGAGNKTATRTVVGLSHAF